MRPINNRLSTVFIVCVSQSSALDHPFLYLQRLASICHFVGGRFCFYISFFFLHFIFSMGAGELLSSTVSPPIKWYCYLFIVFCCDFFINVCVCVCVSNWIVNCIHIAWWWRYPFHHFPFKLSISFSWWFISQPQCCKWFPAAILCISVCVLLLFVRRCKIPQVVISFWSNDNTVRDI